jgi:hypothetical protein
MTRLARSIPLLTALLWGVSSAAEEGKQARPKLALLVGISHYDRGRAGDWWDLPAAPDVQGLRQALVDHFGFSHQNILTLPESCSTRKGILSAFRSHLIDQAVEGSDIYTQRGAECAFSRWGDCDRR